MSRANGCCEYCLKSNLLAYISHQIDHIISLKHGG
ncbi:MAG: HNH endonuclease [Emticicia sp.]